MTASHSALTSECLPLIRDFIAVEPIYFDDNEFRCVYCSGSLDSQSIFRHESLCPWRRADSLLAQSLGQDGTEKGPDVIRLLIRDHLRLSQELSRLAHLRDPLSIRNGLTEFVAEASRHELAEEVAVYPVLTHLEAGELRNTALAQEREAKALLGKVLRWGLIRPRSRHLQRLLEQLKRSLETHARFEEQEIFPLLQREDDDKRRMMGTWVENARSIAPTRPHPHAPQRSAGLIAAWPFLAVSDRCRDFVRRHITGR